MPDFTDPIVMDAIIEKAIEYAPYIALGIGAVLSPIYIIINNKTSNNSHAQFNVAKYIQEFDRVKLSNNINKKQDKNKGVF